MLCIEPNLKPLLTAFIQSEFQPVRVAMELLSLSDLLNHEKFTNFMTITNTWKDQAKIRQVFSDILEDLTGIRHHNHGKGCSVERIAHTFIKKSKTKSNYKLGYSKFKVANNTWMSEQVIGPNCPDTVLQVTQSVQDHVEL